MITSVIGRTFLDAYNGKYKKQFTPKEFFEEEYWELFYNHPKYLLTVTNSPFDQGYKQKRHLTEVGRKRDLSDFKEKISLGKPDASIYPGAPASEQKKFAMTSGLVSDVRIPMSEEEVYLSWIGSGLGIGVGAYSILFDNAEITLQLYEGWKIYRRYLSDLSLEKLRANQINSWNGQWLTYSMGKEFREDFDFTNLADQGIFKVDTSLIEVVTVKWSQLFFSLSLKFPKAEMIGYVYDGFVNTNKTVGFIPFQFKSGEKIKEVYQKLFGNIPIDKNKFENLFGIRFHEACKLGSVGIQALRPDSLKKYMKEDKNLSFKKEEELINYQAYKTWLVAMLTKNKEEITDYTLEMADVILRYRNTGKGNSRITLVEKELFTSKSKKGFIESLTLILPDLENEDLKRLKTLKDEIHLMTNEEFGYFIALLKFDYAFIQKRP